MPWARTRTAVNAWEEIRSRDMCHSTATMEGNYGYWKIRWLRLFGFLGRVGDANEVFVLSCWSDAALNGRTSTDFIINRSLSILQHSSYHRPTRAVQTRCRRKSLRRQRRHFQPKPYVVSGCGP